MYNINQNSNEIIITLYNKGYNKFAVGFLGFFAAIILIFPIFAIMIFINQSNGIPFGFVIICLISVYVSFYLFRLIFWNIYGKEIITITKNRLSVVNDYRFFKDKIKTFSFDKNNIRIFYNTVSENKDCQASESKIYFKLKETTFVTNIALPILSIEEISKKIYSFLD
jgi:hypothetical protein